MKRHKILCAICITVLAIVLMLIGILQLRELYAGYREDMLSYESQHLNSVVSSNARGFAWYLQSVEAQLNAAIRRPAFIGPEGAYLDIRDRAPLTELLANSRGTHNMAVYDGSTLVTTSGASFPVGLGKDVPLSTGVSLRRDDEGTVWFIFHADSERDLTYELAISAQEIYAAAVGKVKVGQNGYLFLFDEGLQLFCSIRGEEVFVGSQEQLLQTHASVSAEDLAEVAQQREALPPEVYNIYRYAWDGGNDTSRGEDTLVVTYPVTMSERTMVMGGAIRLREFNGLLNETFSHVAKVGALVVCSFLLLFGLACWLVYIYKDSTMELAVAKERAEAMEEINREQQSIAHAERLQELGVMTSGIVHEFNNLLTPIMSQSMLLVESLADWEQSAQFENALDIYEASEKAKIMLRRMSSLSKRGDGKYAPVEVGSLVQRTANIAILARSSPVTLQTNLPEEPLYVAGDEQMLSQVVLNICINACQAMQKAGGMLTLTLAREQRDGPGYAVISISDTGPGIPQETMENLYDPFFTTKGQEGTGLGLAVCLKIVESHKGTISASNRPEGGAVFTVRLPLIDPPCEG